MRHVQYPHSWCGIFPPNLYVHQIDIDDLGQTILISFYILITFYIFLNCNLNCRHFVIRANSSAPLTTSNFTVKYDVQLHFWIRNKLLTTSFSVEFICIWIILLFHYQKPFFMFYSLLIQEFCVANFKRLTMSWENHYILIQ